MTSYKQKTQLLVKAAKHIRQKRTILKKANMVGASGNIGKLIQAPTRLLKTLKSTKNIGNAVQPTTMAAMGLGSSLNGTNVAIKDFLTGGGDVFQSAQDTLGLADATNFAGQAYKSYRPFADKFGTGIGVLTGAAQAGQGAVNATKNLYDIYNGDRSIEQFTDLSNNIAQTAAGSVGSYLTAAAPKALAGYGAPLALTVPWFIDASKRALPETNQQMNNFMEYMYKDPTTGYYKPMSNLGFAGNVVAQMGLNAANGVKQMGNDVGQFGVTVDSYTNWIPGQSLQASNQNIQQGNNTINKQQQSLQTQRQVNSAQQLAPAWDSTPNDIRSEVFKDVPTPILQQLQARDQQIAYGTPTGINSQRNYNNLPYAQQAQNAFLNSLPESAYEPRPLEEDVNGNVVEVGPQKLTPYGEQLMVTRRANQAQQQLNRQVLEQQRYQPPTPYYLKPVTY